MFKFVLVMMIVSFCLACVKVMILYSTLTPEQHEMISNGESEALSHSFRRSQAFLYVSGYINVIVALITSGIVVVSSLLDLIG